MFNTHMYWDFKAYNCRIILIFNPTIWYHPKVDGFPFESVFAQGFSESFFLVFVASAFSLEIQL